MIKVENITKFYGDTKVINGVSFEISDGEIFALVGHSGAGKSTLLRCLNGLEDYQSGNVIIQGEEISSLKGLKLREFRKNIGMIFQNFALLDRKNVFENIALPLKFWGYDKFYIKQRVDELLDLVGLKERANFYPSQLSGGQKQRVAIARALALKPKILLSDEATSALDPNTTKQILELLQNINKKLNITIVLVTHEMDVVKSIANRAILLEGGKITNHGSIEELFLRPDEKMKEFLGYEECLPNTGVNIRLFFPKNSTYNSFITKMARDLNLDISIIWGQIEKLNDGIIGNLVINIEEKDKEKIINYISKSEILWEIA